MGKLSKLTQLRSTFRERARSFITNRVSLNVFCPTGKGGGSDPTCSPKGRKSQQVKSSQEEVYHGTHLKLVQKVLKEGLRDPNPGHAAIYTSSSLQEALDFGYGKATAGDEDIETFPIIVVKKEAAGSQDREGSPNFMTRETITPSNILRVDIYKTTDYRKYRQSVWAAQSEGKSWKSISLPSPISSLSPPTINAAKRTPVNPLLVDPTRTTTLQRAFEEQLSKRFAKFQKALTQYVLSGEVVTNAFCPTGSGGGVDPTCSPKKSRGSKNYPEVSKAEYESWSQGKFDSDPVRRHKENSVPLNRFLRVGEVIPSGFSTAKALDRQGKEITGFNQMDASEVKYHRQLVSQMDKEFKSLAPRDLTVYRALANDQSSNKSFVDLGFPSLTIDQKTASVFGDDVIAVRISKGTPLIISGSFNEYEFILPRGVKFNKLTDGSFEAITSVTVNTFCPTGEGGGVDPTCSPKGKKSKLSAAKKKAKVVWFSQDDEEMDYDLADEAFQVAKRSGINILSDKELTAATVERGKVTAALFTGLSGDVYSFDVAVDPPRQGKGLGSQLTDLGLENFGNYADMGASIKLDAVNPQMVEMLKRRGFSVTSQFGGHQIMERVSDEPTDNNAFKFETSEAKVQNFEQWIISKLTETMEDKDIYSGRDWWKTYIERAYKQGADRAFDSMKKKGKADQRSSDRMSGAKNQFFSTFGTEATKERMKLIAGRTYKGMKGLNDMMKTQLTLALIDGLLQGQSPRVIAKALVDKVGVNKTRALMIARTEIVRAHAEGTIASLKALGVKQIGVQVEVAVSGNACPICRKYKGKIFDIDKAQGLIPFHPGCRCTVIPHVTDDTSPQKERQRKNIERSIKSTTLKSLTGNVKKGWSKEARIKSALVRKSKKLQSEKIQRVNQDQKKPAFQFSRTPDPEWKADRLNLAKSLKGDMKKLNQRLTSEAQGSFLVNFGNDPHAGKIASSGKFFSMSGRTRVQSKANNCHGNSCDLLKRKKIDAIATGYVLSDNGSWRVHSWGMNGNKIVETTDTGNQALGYFGVVLSKSEAKQFQSQN